MLELGGRSFAAQHPLLSANLICGLVVGGLLSAAAVAQKSKAAPVSLGIEPISRFSGNVNAEDIGSQEMLEVSEVDASAKFVSVFTADAGLDVHEGDSVPQLQETLPTVRPLEKHESAVHEPIARLANERAEALGRLEAVKNMVEGVKQKSTSQKLQDAAAAMGQFVKG